MTITAEATAEIARTPREILEFVLDLEAYAEVDDKIVRVTSVIGPDEDGRGTVGLWGRVWLFPPAPDKQDFELDRWERLTFTGARRQPARLIFEFTGEFICEPAGGSTRATHRYEFRFKGPLRPLERFVGPWLDRQITAEITDLAERLA